MCELCCLLNVIFFQMERQTGKVICHDIASKRVDDLIGVNGAGANQGNNSEDTCGDKLKADEPVGLKIEEPVSKLLVLSSSINA